MRLICFYVELFRLLDFHPLQFYYDRKERLAGETKYPLKKMLGFAFNGITSFSVTPIRFVMLTGCAFFFTSLLFLCYFLTLKFLGETEIGWTSLITSIWLIGGLQLMAIGLIGEYIGKVYQESKRRPKYIVDIDLFKLSMPISGKGSMKESEKASILLKPISKKAVTKWIDSIVTALFYSYSRSKSHSLVESALFSF